MEYKARLTCPSKDNKYYNSNSNPFVSAGYGMFQNGGNCTCYAWGRAYELLNKKPKLYTGNARTWYGHTEDGYERGQTPKLGAVACWDSTVGKGGHVAVVEEIAEDGTVTFSNSGWKSCLFYITKMKNFDLGSRYKFQGFIYNPNNYDEKPTPQPKPTKSIDEIAKEVIDGKWGNGTERAKRLIEAGYNYDEVQAKVNELLSPKKTTYTVKFGDTLSGIAVKFGTTVQKLIELNKAKYPAIATSRGNYIQAGWTLTIG